MTCKAAANRSGALLLKSPASLDLKQPNRRKKSQMDSKKFTLIAKQRAAGGKCDTFET